MIDISQLKDKKADNGLTPAGRLAAEEWNTLVEATEEVQGALGEEKDSRMAADNDLANRISEVESVIPDTATPSNSLTTINWVKRHIAAIPVEEGTGTNSVQQPGTNAIGENSHSEGIGTEATNPNEHAEGSYNQSVPGTLHSIGIGTSESERKNAMVVMSDGKIYVSGLGGYDGTNIAEADCLAEIYLAVLSQISTASEFGADAKAIAQNAMSTAQAKYTKPSAGIPLSDLASAVRTAINNIGAVKVGNQNAATQQGSGATAAGDRAFGVNKGVASGKLSFAAGNASHSPGMHSASFGNCTSANGDNSLSEGNQCVSAGPQSHSEGYLTRTNNQSEHAQGRCNFSHSNGDAAFGSSENTLHSIGIGISDQERRNAVEVMQNGDVYIYGIGAYNGWETKEMSDDESPVYTLQDMIMRFDVSINELENSIRRIENALNISQE